MVVVIEMVAVKEMKGIWVVRERIGDGGRDGRVGRVCENKTDGKGSQGPLKLSVIDIQRRVTVGDNSSHQKHV
jgi:hypothetical protein